MSLRPPACALLLFLAATLPAAAPAAGPASRPTPRTALVYGEIFLEHRPAAGHPERPERLTAIVDRLRASGLLDSLQLIEPREAPRQWLAAVHSPQYIGRVKAACERGEAQIDTADVSISKRSYAAAVSAAGGVLAAADWVMSGNSRNAFCAIRPPGHHAMRDKAMGFCIFNNVAIAARYLQQQHKLGRILIIDWDVHHGNGTQAAFEEDPGVWYFSVHRAPFYPGTGGADDAGSGEAKGTKLNVPMARGAGDEEYLRVFREKLVPFARKCKPEFVLVSAGFDAHEADPLGGMKLTSRCYAEMTRIVKAIAQEHARGRLISVLEGGYDPRALGESVEGHVRVLMSTGER